MEIVVFTNGCFDILHPGHVELFQKARRLGTKLIVGVNSDRSVRAIKGSPRPFLNENARAFLLSELRSVDEVRIFDENTPERLIRELKPDVLVKGGDWTPEQIVGADFVLKNGGKVFSIPFESDFSSSKIVEKIKVAENKVDTSSRMENEQAKFAERLIGEYTEIFQSLLKNEVSNINLCADLICRVLSDKKRIFVCAENAEDILQKRKPEYFEKIDVNACEQIRKEIQAGDLLIGICANENSSKVISAVMQARKMNCKTVSLALSTEKKLASLSDANVALNAKSGAQFQTALAAVFHIWHEIIDKRI